MLKRVDQAVNSFVGTKDYEKVLNKWFGEPPPFWSTTRVVSVAAGFGLLLFFLMAGWRYYSLIQLNRRLSTSITERKQAEELLRRFQLLVAHSRDIILFLRRDDGRILEANDAATKAYGYNHEQLLAMTIQQLRAPATLGQLADHMAEADTHGILLETFHLRSDGSTFPVEVSSRGETIGGTRALISVIRDITERKRAEEELRESEERHRTILHTAMDGFWMVDMQGRLIQVNEAYSKMSGHSEQELRTMTISDLEVLGTADDAAAHFQEPSAQGADRFETRHRRKDGSIFDVEISVQYRPWEGGQCVAFLRDITERKRAEEVLHATNEQLRALIQSSPEAIIVLDPDGNVKLWNPAAERVFGWREAEVLGKFLPYVPEDKIEEHNALRRRVLKGELTGLEVRRRRKDGSQVDLSISTATLRNAQGQVTGIMSVNIDVTERKLAEEVRRNLEERLQRAEKMEALGTLAGGVAHDLNNVLGVVVGYSELLLREVEDNSGSVNSYAKGILQGGERAAAIVQDLLTLARRGVPS
ncbi:MAG TPA: hypothetical protein DCE18_16820, partial [Syntrophobacteraceae bacterium]|nr:hypothetical protein [Syntrophobacteraceae bacterium]